MNNHKAAITRGVKRGIVFASLLTLFQLLLFQRPFELSVLLFNLIFSSIIFILGSFSRIRAKKRAFKKLGLELVADEQVVSYAFASAGGGLRGIAGMLVLTNHRLIFHSNRKDLNQLDIELELAEIVSIESTKRPFVYISEFEIRLNDDQKVRFKSNRTKEFINSVNAIKVGEL